MFAQLLLRIKPLRQPPRCEPHIIRSNYLIFQITWPRLLERGYTLLQTECSTMISDKPALTLAFTRF